MPNSDHKSLQLKVICWKLCICNGVQNWNLTQQNFPCEFPTWHNREIIHWTTPASHDSMLLENKHIIYQHRWCFIRCRHTWQYWTALWVDWLFVSLSMAWNFCSINWELLFVYFMMFSVYWNQEQSLHPKFELCFIVQYWAKLSFSCFISEYRTKVSSASRPHWWTLT